MKLGCDYHFPGSINVSKLALAGCLHANCRQALGEVLGHEELRRDNNFARLVDISKLPALRKATRKIRFIVFEQMKRPQRSVVASEFTGRTHHPAPEMDPCQSFVKLAGRLKTRLDHHSPRRVDVTPFAADSDRREFLNEVPDLVEASRDGDFPRFVDESPFLFRQLHRRQAMKEVTLVGKC